LHTIEESLVGHELHGMGSDYCMYRNLIEAGDCYYTRCKYEVQQRASPTAYQLTRRHQEGVEREKCNEYADPIEAADLGNREAPDDGAEASCCRVQHTSETQRTRRTTTAMITTT
jgi:hypothetical protein